MTSWVRMFRLLARVGWEIGPVLFLCYVGVSAMALVAPLLLAVGLRPLVDGVVFGRAGRVLTGAVLTAAGLLVSLLTPVGYRWATIRMRELSLVVIQRRLLGLATGAAGVEHFERPEFWDRLQLLKRDAHELTTGMALALMWLVVAAQLLLTAVLLGRLQPLLAFLPFLAVPATWLVRRAEALRGRAELRTAADQRTAHHLFGLASTAASAKEIRLYGLASELLDRHRAASAAVHRGTEAALFRSAALSALSWLLFVLGYVGAVALVLREAAAGRATPGDVALTLALTTAVVMAASQLSELAGSALRIRTVSDHYHWLEAQATPTVGIERVSPPARLELGIELEGVCFGYAGAGAGSPALRDMSLRLPAGSVVAVVGENGAGKTTLVKLLCGMYAPTKGRILVDGVDLATMDVEAYRERLSAGFQDFVRFELVAREAVGVGDLSRLEDERAVRTALGRAGADFVERLPNALDTQLGLSWSGGVDLSGGEWQKLALARSLLRPDPFLVILDEPTASLDPQTEHALFEQVATDSRRGQADGRVTVLISHRFSTVRMADLIVVLDQGRIVEQGSHAELIHAGGLYAELYSLQARAYS